MKEQQIIGKIQGQEIDTIVDFLGSKEFTADQLIAALKNRKNHDQQDILTSQALNEIAERYDCFGLYEKEAFIIYQYAAELGEPMAKARIAEYYSLGISPCAKDLAEAERYCSEVIQWIKLIKTRLNVKNEEYLAVIHSLQLIIKALQHSQATAMKAEANALEKEIMVQKLESLYEKVGNPVFHVTGTLGVTNLELKDASEIDLLDTKIYQEMSNKIKKLKSQAKKDQSLNARLIEAEIALAAYPDPAEILIQRQVQIENHFFDPRRTQNSGALRLARELETRRLSEAELPLLAIDASGTSFAGPARRFITAERSTIQASAEIDPHILEYKDKIGWKRNPNPHRPRIRGKRTDAHYTHYETMDFFGTTIKYCQRINSHKNHLGDYYLDMGGGSANYDKIIQIINNITQKIKTVEVDVARFMLEFVHNGTPVTLASLQTIKQKATQQDVNNLNTIFYHCFIKEVARWMIPMEKSHNLPLATAQARALQLIINGKLRMEDVFAKNARYGVYTGENIGADLLALTQKIKDINDKYENDILSQLPLYQSFKQQNPKGAVVSSRKALRAELQKTFGGETDTDGEGYGSDNQSDNQRKALYKTVMG